MHGNDHLLILGSGYLATAWKAAYPTATVVEAVGLDLTSPLVLGELLDTHKPTFLINAVAYTNTRTAEEPEEYPLVHDLNVTLPKVLHEVCRDREIPWLHLSTGMGFDGTRPDGSGWTEEDTPAAHGAYCTTKAEADAYLQPHSARDRILIARIHLPVSSAPHPRNYLDRLTKFSAFAEVTSSLTVVDDLIPAIDHLRSTQQWGLYHIANPGVLSAMDIARALQQVEALPAGDLESVDASLLVGQTFPVLSSQKLADAGYPLPPVASRIPEIVAAWAS